VIPDGAAKGFIGSSKASMPRLSASPAIFVLETVRESVAARFQRAKGRKIARHGT
jgi:hypothetical protein